MPRDKSQSSTAERDAFVARLKETARSFGSVNALARASGVSEGALRKWVGRHSEPTRDRLVAIARAAQVNVAWLAAGDGPKDRSGDADTPLLEGYVALERVGEPGEGGKRRDGEVAFSLERLRSLSGQTEAELATVQVPDDSMAPLLPGGALLLIDRSGRTVMRDGIYALTLDDALLVRRLQRLPGGELQAAADSEAYQSFRFRQDNSAVTVLGRGLWVGREL